MGQVNVVAKPERLQVPLRVTLPTVTESSAVPKPVLAVIPSSPPLMVFT